MEAVRFCTVSLSSLKIRYLRKTVILLVFTLWVYHGRFHQNEVSGLTLKLIVKLNLISKNKQQIYRWNERGNRCKPEAGWESSFVLGISVSFDPFTNFLGGKIKQGKSGGLWDYGRLSSQHGETSSSSKITDNIFQPEIISDEFLKGVMETQSMVFQV